MSRTASKDALPAALGTNLGSVVAEAEFETGRRGVTLGQAVPSDPRRS